MHYLHTILENREKYLNYLAFLVLYVNHSFNTIRPVSGDR